MMRKQSQSGCVLLVVLLSLIGCSANSSETLQCADDYPGSGADCIWGAAEIQNSRVEIRSVEDMVDGCENRCKEVGSLLISGLQGVEEIDALKFLETASSIYIGANPDLQAIRGFDGLGSLYSLTVDANENLEVIDAFHQITWVMSVKVEYNGKLTELNMFNAVEQIGDREIPLIGQGLTIDSNFGLVDLRGLENVEFISALRIINNRGMETLDGLESSEELSFLQIDNNPKLRSLGSLGETVKRIPQGVRANRNPLLKRCEVEAFIASLESPPEIVDLRELSEEPCD